jgi:hypothetical protein
MLQQIVIADMTNLQWRYILTLLSDIHTDNQWSCDWPHLRAVHYQ